jgi:MFS transporter, YNFM family, putative membrane transport protein
LPLNKSKQMPNCVSDPGNTAPHGHSAGSAARRSLVIGLTAFLTVVDLFATQVTLPSLARAYGVTPAAMGFAVNACTLGMAVAFFGRRIGPRVSVLAVHGLR